MMRNVLMSLVAVMVGCGGGDPLPGVGDPVACVQAWTDEGATTCEPLCNDIAPDRWDDVGGCMGTSETGDRELFCDVPGQDGSMNFVSTGTIVIDGHRGCCGRIGNSPVYWFECEAVDE